MNKILRLLTLSSIIALVQAEVHTLTKQNYDDFFKEHKHALVVFKSPNCHHCLSLAPEYEAASKILEKEGIVLAEVDAPTEQELSKKHDIQGYPTLFVYKNGEKDNYEGGRQRQQIVDYARMIFGEHPKKSESVDDVRAHEANNTKFVLITAKADDPIVEEFTKATEKLRTSGTFFHVIDPNSSNKLIAIRTNEDDVHATDLSKTGIKDFVRNECLPLFGNINGANNRDYMRQNKHMLWLASDSNVFDNVSDIVRQVAKQFRDQANFVWLNIAEYPDTAERGFGVTDLPKFIFTVESNKYVYNEPTGEITAQSLRQFVEDALAGKLPLHLRSEENVTPIGKNVTPVVANNFNDIVNNKNKDVLLLVYAPWCGHCSAFIPEYASLADALSKNSENFVVASINGEANDIGNELFRNFKAYPTLYYWKADTLKPEEYVGDRKKSAILNFLKQNSSFDVPIDDSNKSGEKKEEDEKKREEL